jgi:hypothetical protein
MYLLHHRHRPEECAIAFASWQGFDSPLRRRVAPSTCLAGGHSIWWQVHADAPEGALAMLPGFVAERTEALQYREVEIP